MSTPKELRRKAEEEENPWEWREARDKAHSCFDFGAIAAASFCFCCPCHLHSLQGCRSLAEGGGANGQTAMSRGLQAKRPRPESLAGEAGLGQATIGDSDRWASKGLEGSLEFSSMGCSDVQCPRKSDSSKLSWCRRIVALDLCCPEIERSENEFPLLHRRHHVGFLTDFSCLVCLNTLNDKTPAISLVYFAGEWLACLL